MGSVEDAKDKKYKEIREETKKRVEIYRKEKCSYPSKHFVQFCRVSLCEYSVSLFSALGEKDSNFLVGIQNNVEGFDSSKLVKKVKETKDWDSEKTVCASSAAEMLQGLVKAL